MSLQFVSDIHLDACPSRAFDSDTSNPLIKRLAPNLAVLGDVSAIDSPIFVKFFDNLCARFERVFFVPGNHEYYSSNKRTKSDLDAVVDTLNIKWPNFKVLNRAIFEDDNVFPGICILGCTLWSKMVSKGNAEARSRLHRCVNDFKCIQVSVDGGQQKRPARVEDVDAWHETDLHWLKTELVAAKQRGKSCIVLTHHAPLLQGTSAPVYENRSGPDSVLNESFRSDLSILLENADTRPMTWVFGHTHWPCEFTRHGVLIASNPLGYRSELSASDTDRCSGVLKAKVIEG